MDNMTAERALDVLLEHNEWRRGATDEYPDNPTELGEAIDFACAVLSAPRVPEGYDWVTRAKGYEEGVNELAYELKQLCKDFSDLRDRPYMGDVLAQIDAVAARCLEEIPSAHKATPAPAPADDKLLTTAEFDTSMASSLVTGLPRWPSLITEGWDTSRAPRLNDDGRITYPDTDELARLRARVAELEVDAERYQEVKRRAKRLHQVFVIDLDISVGPTDFECAIDAARLREGRE